MSMSEMSPADIAVLSGNTRNNDGGAWGDNGAWWIVLFILFAAFGGWGNGFGNRAGNNNCGCNNGCGGVNILPVNGFNGFGGFGCYNSCCTPATQQQMTDAFNFSKLDNITSAIQTGICDSTYALNNAINGVNQNISNCCCNTQTAMLQGFNGVDKSLCSGFNGVNQNLNNLSHQVSDCCCETNRNLDSIKYENAKNTADIINAGNANTQRIIDHLTQSEITALRTELQSAQLQLSNNAQTQTLINQLRPCPIPAYLSCSPYTSYYPTSFYGNNNCGCNNGCGCGC